MGQEEKRRRGRLWSQIYRGLMQILRALDEYMRAKYEINSSG